MSLNNKNIMRDKRYWPLFWVQFQGAFNDNFFKNTLVILATYRAMTIANMPAQTIVALCGGLFILPFFLFSAIAGELADKISKDRLIRWIKDLEIAIMMLGAIGFLLQSMGLLLLTLFIMGFQSALFGPVKYSILPELIEVDLLTKGNAWLELGTFLAILLGTISGGIIAPIEIMAKYVVGPIAIGLAVVGAILARFTPKLEAVSPELKIDWKIWKSTWSILNMAKSTTSIFHSVLAISWFWFLGASLISIFPPYVKDVLHADEGVVTMFLSIFSIGVAIGSIICEKMSKERLELGLVPIGSLGLSLFMFDLFFIGKPTFTHDANTLMSAGALWSEPQGKRILIDLICLSISSGLYIVPLYTFIQQRSAPTERSRIVAANNIMNSLLMVLGAIFLTVLYSFKISTPQVFVIMALLNVCAAIYIYTIIPEFLWRFICYLVANIIYRIKVTGHLNIPKEGAAVIVCNHVSFVDWLIIAAAIKRPVRFVMHYSFMKTPLLSFFFRGAKAIPIAGAKESPEILEHAYDEISKALRAGELVCLFPEGQVTSDGNLNPYRHGIEKILKRDQVQVVPLVLKGLWGSFFSRKYPNSFIPHRFWSKVELNIAPAMLAASVTVQALEEDANLRLK